MLLCPSLPWCFPIREVSFEEQLQQQQQQEEKVAKIIIFYGFQNYSEVMLGSFRAQFGCFSVLYCIYPLTPLRTLQHLVRSMRNLLFQCTRVYKICFQSKSITNLGTGFG